MISEVSDFPINSDLTTESFKIDKYFSSLYSQTANASGLNSSFLYNKILQCITLTHISGKKKST